MADPQQLSSKDFAAKIRAKFPGAYDAVDDDTLTSKVLAKYPEYQGRVVAPQQAASAPLPASTDSLSGAQSIAPAPTNNSNYFDRVLGDIRYGTDATPIGTALKAAGAKGSYRGVAPAAADLMTSPLTGANRMMQGQTQTFTGHPLSGAYNTAAGALEASQIPSAFVAPEGYQAINAIPNAERAGAAFNQIKSVAGNIPININPASVNAIEAYRLSKAGNKLPQVIGDFLKRTASGRPVTYAEARDFYSAASNLTGEEINAFKPVMNRQLAKFTQSLGDSIGEAAGKAGQQAQYEAAMREYAQAKTIEEKLAAIKKAVGKTAVYGAATGIVGGPVAYGAKRLYDAFSK